MDYPETPTERLAAENANLRAELQLSEDRNFYLTAENARLRSDLEMARRALDNQSRQS